MAEKKTVLFLGNHFITLYNFRRELIEELCRRGHRVVLSLPESEENRYFTDLGCELIPTPVSRHGMNPAEDLSLVLRYLGMMRRVKPDVIFSYTIKPNIYGCMASNLLRLRQVCNVTGTGGTFLKENALAKIARLLYRISVRHCSKVFFQNVDDKNYFVRHRMVRDNWALLPGSGVNLDLHPFFPLPEGEEIRFLYIGRIMAVKGIDQYLDCARAIRSKHPNTRFYLAGFVEEERFRPILEQCEKEGVAEYIGFRKDIDDWIHRCHCTVLPSLGGEGVPNVLLESAASGRVCIASDVSGSREVIADGETGYLFRPGDSADLIEKVERFLSLSREEMAEMGRRGREKASWEFDRDKVVQRYLQEVEG